MKRLRELSDDTDATIKKLALLSECAIFKDILPGYCAPAAILLFSYHIRELTDKERSMPVITCFHRLHLPAFEGSAAAMGFRTVNSHTLQIILTSVEKHVHSENRALYLIAARCMCELLTAHPEFNFRSNIISLIVPLMNSSDEEVSESARRAMLLSSFHITVRIQTNTCQLSKLCCETVQSLFRSDVSGSTTLEIVKLISQMIKAKGYHVKPAVLQCFMQLPLAEEIDAFDLYGRKAKPEKKKRKKGLEREVRVCPMCASVSMCCVIAYVRCTTYAMLLI